ncbi:unnamed protein product (mitochondrion) [Plasmodiophora brassicae]|uniref:Secreted protein n=1 Tax=Plasmodiophora brassicae TaxID=37360 RepID=A0A3P3YF34_PLABS|nr:unnamed protein product [Plasmodiophora brassicae]
MHSCWSWPFSIVVIVAAAAAAAAGVLASDDSARDDTIDLDLRRGTRRQLVDDWSPVSHRHEICVQKSPPLVLSVLLSKLSNVSATEADGCHVLCTLTLKGHGRAPTIKLKLVIRASGPMDAQVKIRRHIFGLTFRPGTGMLSQAGSWAVASSIESLIRIVARRERNMTNARRVRLVGKGFPGRARDVDRRTAALPEVARRGFSGDDRGAAVHAHDYQGRTPLHPITGEHRSLSASSPQVQRTMPSTDRLVPLGNCLPKAAATTSLTS